MAASRCVRELGYFFLPSIRSFLDIFAETIHHSLELHHIYLSTGLTCGLIQIKFFFRVKVLLIELKGKSGSSCKPFAPRDNRPFSCRPCVDEPPEDCGIASVAERVEI